MSKALKCDRCGEYFAPKDFSENEEYGRIYKYRTFNAESTSDVAFEREMLDIDLCPKCALAFDFFMKGFDIVPTEHVSGYHVEDGVLTLPNQ